MKKYLQFFTICAVVIFTAGNVWGQTSKVRPFEPGEIIGQRLSKGVIPSFSLLAVNIYYVDPLGDDGSGDGSAGSPWLTIQHAVDIAVDGDVINVAAGTYTGAIVDEDLNIIGAVGGGSIINTGVLYKTGSSLKTAFRLNANADGAEIRNFTINCDETSLFYFAVFARTVDNVIIDGLTVSGAVQGISNWGGSYWEITNNNMIQTVASGGGGIAIFLGALAGTGYPICSNNLVQNNTIDASAMATTYSCPGICLSLDVRYGGYGNLTGGEVVSDNEILDNHIIGNGADGNVGIEVGVILGNSGTDPDRTDPVKIANLMTLAIVNDNTIKGNTTDGLETGIFFYNTSNLEILENTVQNCIDFGVYIDHGNSNNKLQFNSIASNTNYGVYNNSGSEVYGSELNATCNWWGDVSGPTHANNPGGGGDAVSDNVKYLPWLVAVAPDGSCEGGTPLVIKSGVRDYLATLLPSSDKKTVKILEKAIKHLKKSLADELWEDNDHLSSKGIKVFEEEKTAVHELMKINELDVSTSIDALVEADRMLAQIAIDETVNDKDKAKAVGEMDKALDETSNGNFDKAIEHYKQAWHQATKALKNQAKSFANSDVEEGSELVDSAIPEVFGLRENYPNPFNPTTLISYDLPEASQVSMTVYDMMGRQVKSLVQEFQPAGNHSVIWNATNDNGTRMSGGIYFYQIKAGSFLQTHKMILLK